MRLIEISPFNRKIFAIAAALMVLAFSDNLLPQVALWLFHNLIELFYTLFEIVEISLDRIVEHVFHTGLHVTQIIVFYILLSAALWICYRLWHAVPSWYKNSVVRLQNFWIDQMYSVSADWEAQTLLEKIYTLILLALFFTLLFLLI